MISLESVFRRAAPCPNRILVSVHIPKCGGISFEHVLRRIFGDRRVWLNYGVVAGRSQARPELIPPQARCIHGHFPSDTFDDIVPTPHLVTWLRHPVERVVSNYHHFLRHADPANPCSAALHGRDLSLEAFAELEGMRNEASRYLAGKPLGAFDFVGITEKFEQSLRVFGAAFGFSVPASAPHENVNPGRRMECYPISDRVYEKILQLNLIDLQNYELAVARLEGRPQFGAKPIAA